MGFTLVTDSNMGVTEHPILILMYVNVLLFKTNIQKTLCSSDKKQKKRFLDIKWHRFLKCNTFIDRKCLTILYNIS